MKLSPPDRSVAELLRDYRQILDELRARGVTRTDNAPTGDYAEYLVARLVGGQLAPNSERSFGVLTPDGVRIQVKARIAVEGKPGTRQLSVIRSWDFDELVVVLFDRCFEVHRAASVPVDIARERSTYNPHVNGNRLIASDALWEAPKVRDITNRLRSVTDQ